MENGGILHNEESVAPKVPTYAEAFPPLVSSSPASDGGNTHYPAMEPNYSSSIKSIPMSTVTQVTLLIGTNCAHSPSSIAQDHSLPCSIAQDHSLPCSIAQDHSLPVALHKTIPYPVAFTRPFLAL